MSLNRSMLIVSDILPLSRRRRVFVEQMGAGLTIEHTRLGNMIMGVAVLLDTGERAFVPPDHVQLITEEDTAPPENVVQFVPRARLGGEVRI